MTKIKGYVEKLLQDCDEQYRSWLDADREGRRHEEDEDGCEREASSKVELGGELVQL